MPRIDGGRTRWDLNKENMLVWDANEMGIFRFLSTIPNSKNQAIIKDELSSVSMGGF